MGKSNLKKNLLLVHLESLNQLNYRMNPELFPFLKKIERECLVFNNYYSTATSTLMVIGELLYGGLYLYEECKNFDDAPDKYCYTSSLFDDLKDKGYNTGIYIYPDANGTEGAESRHLAGFKHSMELLPDYSEYMESFERKMSQEPFALMACNYISNLSFNTYVDINKYGMDEDFWEVGYRGMDKCCADLLELLKNKDRMENTVVVFYGDHGDDYWGHGMHSGWTHGIEPNLLLIHTPLFVWDGTKRTEPEYDARLIQTTDLRELIERLLEGKSISDLPRRKYAISRNEYAAQPIRMETLNKAYSVTDGYYLLMVSGKGLEMYDNKSDPACQNNLLRFFDYKNSVLKASARKRKGLAYQFTVFMDARKERIIRQKFYELLAVLKEETLKLYVAGGRTEDDMLGEMRFDVLAK